jgi:hypothetical protein
MAGKVPKPKEKIDLHQGDTLTKIYGTIDFLSGKS